MKELLSASRKSTELQKVQAEGWKKMQAGLLCVLSALHKSAELQKVQAERRERMLAEGWKVLAGGQKYNRSCGDTSGVAREDARGTVEECKRTTRYSQAQRQLRMLASTYAAEHSDAGHGAAAYNGWRGQAVPYAMLTGIVRRRRRGRDVERERQLRCFALRAPRGGGGEGACGTCCGRSGGHQMDLNCQGVRAATTGSKWCVVSKGCWVWCGLKLAECEQGQGDFRFINYKL